MRQWVVVLRGDRRGPARPALGRPRWAPPYAGAAPARGYRGWRGRSPGAAGHGRRPPRPPAAHAAGALSRDEGVVGARAPHAVEAARAGGVRPRCPDRGAKGPDPAARRDAGDRWAVLAAMFADAVARGGAAGGRPAPPPDGPGLREPARRADRHQVARRARRCRTRSVSGTGGRRPGCRRWPGARRRGGAPRWPTPDRVPLAAVSAPGVSGAGPCARRPGVPAPGVRRGAPPRPVAGAPAAPKWPRRRRHDAEGGSHPRARRARRARRKRSAGLSTGPVTRQGRPASGWRRLACSATNLACVLARAPPASPTRGPVAGLVHAQGDRGPRAARPGQVVPSPWRWFAADRAPRRTHPVGCAARRLLGFPPKSASGMRGGRVDHRSRHTDANSASANSAGPPVCRARVTSRSACCRAWVKSSLHFS